MAINTLITAEEWGDFLVIFSNDTRGRAVIIQVIDPVSGDAGEVARGPLLAIDYDPIGKGNDIIVSLGTEEIENSHTIEAPEELWRAQHNNGEIIALEIIDQNGGKTILSL